MAEYKPINWAFPFKLKGAAGEASKDVTNPELYYAALAQAKDGFFPMGASGNWHGGVHFDEGTGTVLDQSEVHCIADGEVIAYRIDEQYPTTAYGEAPAIVNLPFSTGFVLVKHRLELPPKPAEPTAGAASDTPTAAPALTFFSLYMHLQDWASYQAQPTLPRPGFWGDGLCKVKADAPDKLLGLNVHAHHKTSPDDPLHAEYDHILATLPRGTTVTTGAANGGMLKVVSVTPTIDGLEASTGWVHKSYMKNLGANQYLIGDKAEDVLVPLQSGANVRSALIDSSRDVLAWLPKGAQLRISDEGAPSKYRKLVGIISGHPVPALTADSSGKLPGFVWLDSLEITHEPKAHDGSVVVLDQPVAIKAGELIGHIGKYQNVDDSHPRSMLHLEVFSCEDVPAFINQSKAWAESLPAEQKTLIKIHEGSTVIQPTAADTQIASGTNVRVAADSPTEGCWAKVHPYVALKVNKSDLGTYSSKQYPLSDSQKSTIASAQGIDASEMPDQVDFLMETYLADGSDPQPYASGSIPTTRPMRKIGVRLNTPVWVKRSKLNSQGQLASTSSTLDAWKSFPLSQAADGQACGFERILSKASWNDLSVEHKAIDTNAEKTHWWYVTVANATGQEISGWVPEFDPIITKHSPWEWPGFSQIADTTPLVSQQAQTLGAQGTLSTEESRSYAAQIDEAERGALFQRLFAIIDQPNAAGVKDKKLTPSEIKCALGKPWLAQQLSLLITHYESEWISNPSKWNELDPLMRNTPGQPNLDWEKEKQRIEKLSWWSELVEKYSIGAEGQTWHINPSSIVINFKKSNTSNCGCQLGKIFTCVRYTGSTTQYGPLYKGSISLESYANWEVAISNGVVTEEGKSIFIAMSPNEGNLDAIQSYDSEILTAGAMQKTINPTGSGEFPMQVLDLQEKHPSIYEDLFARCGWTVQGPRHTAKMYYSDSELTSGIPITAGDLKSLIRTGYSQSTQGLKFESKPLAAILTAIKSTHFIEQQILDFSKRMKSVLEIRPTGYEFKISEILKSALGKATALDHHINRPGYVDDDLGDSLDRFFASNPSAPTNISTWGSSHENYELALLEDYGNTRRMAMQNGASVAPSRYAHLKDKLQ